MLIEPTERGLYCAAGDFYIDPWQPVARAVCWLLSDWACGISGEIVHVDGGFHAMGAPLGGSRLAADSDEPNANGQLSPVSRLDT